MSAAIKERVGFVVVPRGMPMAHLRDLSEVRVYESMEAAAEAIRTEATRHGGVEVFRLDATLVGSATCDVVWRKASE
jgi:ornithine cyclodeaminase/alanine dehydrogenase-like protein (mu-crystallin family)